MAYRNIVIQSDARLTLRRDQLCISADREATIAIEDIDMLLIESRQTVVSTALMTALAQSGVAMMVCDEKHLPCAVLMPYMQHSRQLEAMQNQLALALPTKKRLWQQVVRAKIQNQARCLSLLGKTEDAAHLETLAKTVRSGDEGFVEGHAAAYYFPALFEEGFTRGADEDLRNSCLNYGYAILRGCIARSLAVYGFLPVFGLQHHSSLNQFNLADDLIEPFRPAVDLLVAKHITDDASGELSPAMKRELINVINCDIVLDGKKYGISYAIERMVQSLVAVCAGRAGALLLPELIEIAQHEYE
jgi:CRISPR-associated protein Cas1